jgi:hypothetical protein
MKRTFVAYMDDITNRIKFAKADCISRRELIENFAGAVRPEENSHIISILETTENQEDIDHQ